MIKRSPQEIADFYGAYVAQDKDGDWYLYEKAPVLDLSEAMWRDGGRSAKAPHEAFMAVPKNHDWTKLYEPQGKEGKTEGDFPYSTENTDSDNKAAPYSEKQADSDNKDPIEVFKSIQARHQSQVHVHAEYCIVTNINPVGLSEHVHELVSEGWRPQGGVAVEHLPKSEGYVQDCCYHQAMMRGME